MLNRVKNYFKNNIESIAMGLAVLSGSDIYPYIQ